MTEDFTVTPYAVEGTVDYEKLLNQFGADELTADQSSRFPDLTHPLVRRRIYYAGRDVDPFLDAVESSEQCSIVTGIGPSGPMHIGHIFPFYFAKELQDRTGAHVYIPLSDDEKYFAKDLSFREVQRWTEENLRDILAVGFDPERTRIIVDTEDSDVVYPVAAEFAKHYTQSTVNATYGEPANVGLSFYPAVQATHLLLPQLVHGRHRTLVPIAVDQDPHVRLCRDVAGKAEYDLSKPAALLSRFLPQLEGAAGKMSSSEDAPAIELTDDRETVTEKIQQYAYSGGQSSVDAHREHGGDPDVDVAYQLLYYFFEPDDEIVQELADQYRSGELLSGELKQTAADRIASFLETHQRRRPAREELREELAPFRLSDDERERAVETALN